jgi:hypothetical protein
MIGKVIYLLFLSSEVNLGGTELWFSNDDEILTVSNYLVDNYLLIKFIFFISGFSILLFFEITDRLRNISDYFIILSLYYIYSFYSIFIKEFSKISII